jgi:hypothetical protein
LNEYYTVLQPSWRVDAKHAKQFFFKNLSKTINGNFKFVPAMAVDAAQYYSCIAFFGQ